MWAKIFTAGIPIADVSDKHVAVVEAVRLHRLLATGVTMICLTGAVDGADRFATPLPRQRRCGRGRRSRAAKDSSTAPTTPTRDPAVALKLLTVVTVADYGRIVERSAPFTTITHPNLMAHVEVFIGTGLTTDTAPDIADFDIIYTVADWIDGQTLPDVVDTTDTTHLLGYIAGIARGLDALHRHRSPDAPLGIVHRDVKPSNVRITDEPPQC